MKATAAGVEKALYETLISPNEADRNMEPANIVDGLFAIARALLDVARAIESLQKVDIVDAVFVETLKK